MLYMSAVFAGGATKENIFQLYVKNLINEYIKSMRSMLLLVIESERCFRSIPGQFDKLSLLQFLIVESRSLDKAIRPYLHLFGLSCNPKINLVPDKFSVTESDDHSMKILGSLG